VDYFFTEFLLLTKEPNRYTPMLQAKRLRTYNFVSVVAKNKLKDAVDYYIESQMKHVSNISVCLFNKNPLLLN
jgi:hypothetical protein